MKRIGYLRCATQDGAARSFGHQRSEIDERLGRDGHVADEWVDEVGTGTELGHGFEALLARAEAGERVEIHVARLDRVARDARALREALARAAAASAPVVARNSAALITMCSGRALRRPATLLPNSEEKTEAGRG